MDELSGANGIIIQGISYDLKSLEQFIWQKLVNGAVKPKHNFHTMVVSTVNLECESTIRTVVNRKVDEKNKIIYFYTDKRSRKFKNLLNSNKLSLLLYDSRQQTQVVIKAIATLHTNDFLANEKWNSLNLRSRSAYMSVSEPNSMVGFPTNGLDEKFNLLEPTLLESDLYSQNFTVISCQVLEIEFLQLQKTGHRKAIYSYLNGEFFFSSWLIP